MGMNKAAKKYKIGKLTEIMRNNIKPSLGAVTLKMHRLKVN